ncbi:MAG: hypothetical protein ABIQ18_20890 [Umezawaea sp.]
MDLLSGAVTTARFTLAFGGACLVLVVLVTGVRLALATGDGSKVARVLVRATGTAFRWVAKRLGAVAGERVVDLSAPVGMLLLLVCGLAAAEAGVELIAFGAGDEVAACVGATVRAVLLISFGVHLLRSGDAYSRRERALVQFDRTREAEELLAGFLDAGGRERLDQVMAGWAAWLAELRRANQVWPVLLHSRSSGEQCWLETVVTMLDVAALAQSVAPSWAPVNTTPVLVIGTDCLSRALVELRVEQPRSTISLHGREDRLFDDTVQVLSDAGMRLECDLGHAWAEFQARRTRYAPVASVLATRLLYKRFGEKS